MRERVVRVFALLDELTEALPVPSSHREPLQAHLGLGREQAEDRPGTSAVQLPLLVHAGVAGEEAPALPVAAACTLFGLGVDLFDSMIDDELPPFWRARDPAEVSLAATTLLAALPQLSIARLREAGIPPAKLWELARLFADTLLVLNAGQHEDVLFPGLEDVSLEDSRAMVGRKSGAANALFARAGAVLATEETFVIEAYASFGLCLGIARQLMNDMWGIWGEATSRDLLNGKRTFPIVHALTVLHGARRKRLQRLLADARESTGHHDEARALLAAAGSLRYTALVVWLYQQRARNHLAAASPREPAGRELRMLLDRISILPRRQEA